MVSPDSNWDSIFWYRSGPGGSRLWLGQGDGSWIESTHQTPLVATPIRVRGNWDKIHLWSTTKSDYIWESQGQLGDKYEPTNNTEIGVGYTPIVGKRANGTEFILWYKPGTAPEYYWRRLAA